MEIYIFSAAKTLAVSSASVGFLAADMAPTTGNNQGRTAETVLFTAVVAVYVEFGGGAATTGGMPLAAGTFLTIEGYENIKNLRFIRVSGDATVVATFGYR